MMMMKSPRYSEHAEEVGPRQDREISLSEGFSVEWRSAVGFPRPPGKSFLPYCSRCRLPPTTFVDKSLHLWKMFGSGLSQLSPSNCGKALLEQIYTPTKTVNMKSVTNRRRGGWDAGRRCCGWYSSMWFGLFFNWAWRVKSFIRWLYSLLTAASVQELQLSLNEGSVICGRRRVSINLNVAQTESHILQTCNSSAFTGHTMSHMTWSSTCGQRRRHREIILNIDLKKFFDLKFVCLVRVAAVYWDLRTELRERSFQKPEQILKTLKQRHLMDNIGLDSGSFGRFS